jgi:hypothetical protein
MHKPTLAVATAIAAAATVTACGGGPNTQTVQGQVLGGTQAAATAFSALGGGSGICGGAIEGTQVIVKGPSGTLLATTTLHKDAKATSALSGPLTVLQAGRGLRLLNDDSCWVRSLHNRSSGSQQSGSLRHTAA